MLAGQRIHDVFMDRVRKYKQREATLLRGKAPTASAPPREDVDRPADIEIIYN